MGNATLANLLAQMTQNQEVLQGWDAVLNLLESSVNEFLQVQWNQQTKGAGQITVETIWAEGVNRIADQYFTNVYEFSFVMGAPLFQFPNGQATVNVTQAIQSGSYRSGTLIVPSNFDPATAKFPFDDPNVQWSGPATIVSSAANASISGTVGVEQIQGVIEVSTAISLVLDFAKGAFTLNNLKVSGVSDSDLSAQLQDWFATNKIQYVLSSVDTANYSSLGLPSFRPTSFQFNVITTNGGNNVVQLLITTDGSQPVSMTISVDEPVPTDDGLTCSLMISSRILYNDILIPGFATPGSSFSLVPIYPNTGQIWTAAINPEFHFSGSFSYGNCCDRVTDNYNIYLGGTYSGSATSGFVLNQNVQTGGNAPVDITVYASYPVALSGTGKAQQISITPTAPQITVSGSEEGELLSDLQNILNGDFQNGMAGISFASITNFALQNVLFPGNLIQMSQAQVPGDLLIVGTFTPTS
jgi:hypothetical protein